MECSCEADVYDGDCEPVDLLNINMEKARKVHKCGECREEINIGDSYQHASYRYEGKFYIDKTCLDCMSAINKFYPRGGHSSGGLWDDIFSHIYDRDGEIPESCLADMTIVARNKVCDIINEYYREKND